MNNARSIEVDGRKSINSLVFLEDSKHFLSGGEDGTIRQWRIDDGSEIEDQRLTAPGGAVRAIAISRDGNWIVSTGNKISMAWNRQSREIAHMQKEFSGWVNSVDVSPDSTKYATGAGDQGAILWAISNGKKLVVLESFGYSIKPPAVIAVKFFADGNRIVVATLSHYLGIHDAYGGQCLQSLDGSNLPRCSHIALAKDGRNIFALSNNVISHLRDDLTPLSKWNIPGHSRESPKTANGLALPDHDKFIAAITSRTLTFWDISTHVRLGPVLEHLQVNHLCSMALSPDNHHVVTGSGDGVITLRNLDDIIPSSMNVDRMMTPTEVQGQTVAHDTISLAVESRSEVLNTQPDDRIQVIVQRIPDGVYRIKSIVGELYLTCPQAGTGTVGVKPLNKTNASQLWTVSLVGNSAYEVTSSSELSLTAGMGAPLLVGPKNTTWTFDPRGEAYAIGNAANIMALQLEPYPPSVSVLPRNDSPYQRWVLEFWGERESTASGTSEIDPTSSRGRRDCHSRGRMRRFAPRQS